MSSLLDVWLAKKDFFESKTVGQVLSFSGDGNLRDGSDTSKQLRELLANVPLPVIRKYVDECLSHSFQQGGFVLQDLINEVGRRLGFSVEPGLYRGGSTKIGFDGIWKTKQGHSFVIEVKTTDAYQVNLDTQATYRRKLIAEGRLSEDSSSILLVVGRNDTGGLEAQTRGSKHAWDIRIIGVDALLRLLSVKENLSETSTVLKIQEILKPVEHTRVDRLIDVVFAASEDLQVDSERDDLRSGSENDRRATSKPMSFHNECISRLSAHFKTPLIKQGRCSYTNAAQSIHVLCIVSKEYQRGGTVTYWYAFHRNQQDFLSDGAQCFIALGCGSPDQIVLIPFSEFQKHLPDMNTTESDGRFYWHVFIHKKGGRFLLNKPTSEGVDITRFFLK